MNDHILVCDRRFHEFQFVHQFHGMSCRGVNGFIPLVGEWESIFDTVEFIVGDCMGQGKCWDPP